jgi:hypothetical protein
MVTYLFPGWVKDTGQGVNVRGYFAVMWVNVRGFSHPDKIQVFLQDGYDVFSLFKN